MLFHGRHSSPSPHLPLTMNELEPLFLKVEVKTKLGNSPWPENEQHLSYLLVSAFLVKDPPVMYLL